MEQTKNKVGERGAWILLDLSTFLHHVTHIEQSSTSDRNVRTALHPHPLASPNHNSGWGGTATLAPNSALNSFDL